MRRSAIVALVVIVPALLFMNVLQAYRFSRLEREIVRLERRQAALIEENKRAILAISVLTSPSRVGELASEELGLVRVNPRDITTIDPPGYGGGR
ncbi:MAG: cell division protein FtsL [Spirochaetaceae bacterium]|nr:MAG: cell division protein FtsL [Spirochaetaceae bacterium]